MVTLLQEDEIKVVNIVSNYKSVFQELRNIELDLTKLNERREKMLKRAQDLKAEEVIVMDRIEKYNPGPLDIYELAKNLNL